MGQSISKLWSRRLDFMTRSTLIRYCELCPSFGLYSYEHTSVLHTQTFFIFDHFQCKFSDRCFEVGVFALEMSDLICGGITDGGTRQAVLACLEEVLGPLVVDTGCDTLFPGQLGDAYLASQAFKYDTDFFLSREFPACSIFDCFTILFCFAISKLLSGAKMPDYGAENRRFQVVSCMQETT